MTMKSAMRGPVVRTYRSIFARPVARRFNEVLFDLALRGLGVGNYENDVVSGERHFIKDVLARHVRNATAPVVLDIGAHDGNYAQMILDYFPRASLTCVEPNPSSFAALERRMRGRATVLECALGATPGVMMLYDRADESGSQHASMYEDVINNLHGQAASAREVTVRTLDDLAADLALPFIDLLKIDTEGHELQVLLGADKLLGAGEVGVVQIEFNEMNLYSRTFFRDFRERLSAHTPYRLLPHGFVEVRDMPLRSELFGFQNIVFLPCR